jgi:hypothetical protein
MSTFETDIVDTGIEDAVAHVAHEATPASGVVAKTRPGVTAGAVIKTGPVTATVAAGEVIGPVTATVNLDEVVETGLLAAPVPACEVIKTGLVTATVNSNEVAESQVITATVTAQAPLTPHPPVTPAAKISTQASPNFIRPNFERMPAGLKLLKNWVLWGGVWNGSKWTKRPIQMSGYGASTTNPRHWSSFDDAKQAYERAVAQGYMELRERGKPAQQVAIGGVGFVFDGHPDADGLVFAGVDFDNVISGDEIAPFAKECIRRLGSYTERSVSGGGLHVIVKARPLASGVTHAGVEMYTSGRFFTMTGDTL